MSPNVDIDTILIIQLNNSDSQMVHLLPQVDKMYHKENITIKSLKLFDAGDYSCTYHFVTAIDNQFVIESDVKMVTTNITIKSELSIIH